MAPGIYDGHVTGDVTWPERSRSWHQYAWGWLSRKRLETCSVMTSRDPKCQGCPDIYECKYLQECWRRHWTDSVFWFKWDTVESYMWKWCDEVFNRVQHIKDHVVTDDQFSLSNTHTQD